MLPYVVSSALIDECLFLVVQVDGIVKVSLAQGRAWFAHGEELYGVMRIR